MLPRAQYPELARSVRLHFVHAMSRRLQDADVPHEVAADLTYFFMGLCDVPEQIIQDRDSALRAMQYLGLHLEKQLCSV